MSPLVAWIAYPLLLLALGGGLGLLLDRLSGRRLPGVLVVPAGLAVAAVVDWLGSLAGATAGAIAAPLAIGAAFGAGLSLPWRFARPDPAPLATALAVFLLAAVPPLVSGEPSGEAFEPELAWAFPPFLALGAAALALCLWRFAGSLAAGRPGRPGAALLVAAPLLLALLPGALAYAEEGPSAYGRLAELQRIEEGYAGQGPALLLDDSTVGAESALGDLEAEGAGTVDVDEVPFDTAIEYRTLLLRRSERGSRPPSPYRLAFAGEHYEVWQRPLEPEGLPPEHLALGSAGDPAAVPDCSQVVGLGLLPLVNAGAGSVRMIAATPQGELVSAEDPRELCGKRWDWIEAIGGF